MYKQQSYGRNFYEKLPLSWWLKAKLDGLRVSHLHLLLSAQVLVVVLGCLGAAVGRGFAGVDARDEELVS